MDLLWTSCAQLTQNSLHTFLHFVTLLRPWLKFLKCVQHVQSCSLYPQRFLTSTPKHGLLILHSTVFYNLYGPSLSYFHPFPPMCSYLSCPAAFLRVAPCLKMSGKGSRTNTDECEPNLQTKLVNNRGEKLCFWISVISTLSCSICSCSCCSMR